MIYYLMAFFLSFGVLFADEDSSVATLANDPSTIVGGAVNVITGELLGSEEDRHFLSPNKSQILA
jgi:hypothetical protein